jgi:phosphatidylserine decarboxylase
MKHSGKAARAALRLVWWTLVLLLAILAAGVVARYFSAFISTIAGALVAMWVVFAALTFYFFRDPEPKPVALSDPKAVLAPAHGKVDMVDEVTEPELMGGPCRRISTFMSILDVHVQRAPVSGKVTRLEHKPGQFLSATKAHSTQVNEQVLVGLEPTDAPGAKVGLRLIAGVIARRVVPWIRVGELVNRGERISLIQFGSRVDLLLPLAAQVLVQPGTRVKAGETVVARMP